MNKITKVNNDSQQYIEMKKSEIIYFFDQYKEKKDIWATFAQYYNINMKIHESNNLVDLIFHFFQNDNKFTILQIVEDVQKKLSKVKHSFKIKQIKIFIIPEKYNKRLVLNPSN